LIKKAKKNGKMRDQIQKIMQNKPNFKNTKINVTSFAKKEYEKKTLGQCGKNKPNSNPIQSQF